MYQRCRAGVRRRDVDLRGFPEPLTHFDAAIDNSTWLTRHGHLGSLSGRSLFSTRTNMHRNCFKKKLSVDMELDKCEHQPSEMVAWR